MATRQTKVYPKYGDEGLEVLKYQKLLAKTGSKIKLNGRFTIGMTTAIKSFQKKNKLKVTGMIDIRTAAMLDSYKVVRRKAK